MPAKKSFPPPPKVIRGRRSAADKDSKRWRLSIREVKEVKGRFQWTTYLVQGWREGSVWQRKRFKTRAEAETFKANKELELVPTDDVHRVTISTLSQSETRAAEEAFDLLRAQPELLGVDGAAVELSIVQAVRKYLDGLRAAHTVERKPLLSAMESCIADKIERNGMRHRSAGQLRSSLRSFAAWLRLRPEFDADSLNPAWSPDVLDITAEHLTGFLASIRGSDGRQATAKTWNNIRADVASLWSWCLGLEGRTPIRGCRRRWALSNITSDVPTARITRDATPATLTPEQAGEFMRGIELSHPDMVSLFALALFAGIRPSRDGELFKVARHPGCNAPCPEASSRPLVDLQRHIITIPWDISKTSQKRIIPIQPNLAQWLNRYGCNLLPVGWRTKNEEIRKKAKLSHDVLRHTFVSNRTAVAGMALAALESGNSEGIIREHYLNLPSPAEAAEFWAISPTL